MISLALILVVLGALAGLARGGRLSNITRARFKGAALVFSAMAVQIAAEVFAGAVNPQAGGHGFAVATIGASYLLLLWFVVLNRRLAGMVLIGIGLALNFAVISANGGMPVSQPAASVAGLDAQDYLRTSLRHVPMDDQSKLNILGDAIPLVGLKKVASPGDLVLGLGIFLLIERLVRYDPRRLRHVADLAIAAPAD